MNSGPLVTIRSPGLRLLITSTRSPFAMPTLIWRNSIVLSSCATQIRT